MRFGAAIFDLDGTLLDTESQFITAGISVLSGLGHEVGRSFMVSLVGIGREEGHRRLCGHIGTELEIEGFYAAWNAAAHAAFAGQIPLRPGVAELLALLAVQGLPRAVATNSATDSARRKLAAAGIGGHFDPAHVLGWDAVAAPKPAPDVYLAAAARLGVAPEYCIAFEDSDTGVAAALAAGMVVVHVPDMAPPQRHDAHHRAETILEGARACGLIR